MGEHRPGATYRCLAAGRRVPLISDYPNLICCTAARRGLPAGLIRHLGVSEVTPEQLDQALSVEPVVCVQNRYGIGASAEEHQFVDACGERGIAFVPFFAIAGEGRGAGVAGTENEDVLAVARARGMTAAQVRLAWTLQRGPHVLAIPGTGDPGHLAENVAAGALRLTETDMTRLSAVRGDQR